MKIPVFIKTIGFRLTIWYLLFFFLIGAMLIVGFNLTLELAQSYIPQRFTGDLREPSEIARVVGESYGNYLTIYSWISLGGLLILCGFGGYFLSRKMLQPIDHVATLATRISTSNLQERINYEGPDDEMKRLADTFDNMLNRLEDSFSTQNQFIQDASHELKTPIAIARTNIEVIEMDENPSKEDYRQLVEVLKMTTERMSQLSDKLLLLSKSQQPITEKKLIDMVPMIKDIQKEVGIYAADKEIELTFETSQEDLLLECDSFAIKHAVINLIDNAIKYSQPDGKVKISTYKEGNHAIITVEDNGIGISEENQKYIFDRFYRVDKSRSRAQGGTGLGLAIVKEIVESHNGNITVKSEPDKGSIFRISLPLFDKK